MKAADENGFRVLFLRTVSPEEVLMERLIRREREGESVSDATVAILERFISDFEEPEELKETDCYKVDTKGPPGEAVETALKDMIFSGIDPS